MNPNLARCIDALTRLHVLYMAGRFDSPEADAIRDTASGAFEQLDENDRLTANGVALLMNGAKDALYEAAPATIELTAEHGSMDAKLLLSAINGDGGEKAFVQPNRHERRKAESLSRRKK